MTTGKDRRREAREEPRRGPPVRTAERAAERTTREGTSGKDREEDCQRGLRRGACHFCPWFGGGSRSSPDLIEDEGLFVVDEARRSRQLLVNGGMSFLPGMFPFALPGAGTLLLQAPMAVSPFQTPVPQPSPFLPQVVNTMAPVNLNSALNVAGPSRPPQSGRHPQSIPEGHCISIENDDGECDIPRAHKKKKGKNLRRETSRDSAFDKLGEREECQRKSAKLRKRKKFTYLSTTWNGESENLTKFLTQWKDEVDKVEEMDDKTVLSLLLNDLRAGQQYKEFCRRPPTTYQEAYHAT
ncbi:unnamed protein product [Cuscuta campestris]|uniref:Uncharacterized protein n=1 Tax=Cuscuta campestris TaxID=132261 RepID=A0A484MMN1_9ASTE|nr:unnamed protein product [Cuscuta campestris]